MAPVVLSVIKCQKNIPIVPIDRNFCMQKSTAPLRDQCLTISHDTREQRHADFQVLTL